MSIEENAFWADLYQFRKYFDNPNDTDAFWKELMRVAEILYAKYKHCEFNKNDFVNKMIFQVIEVIEAINIVNIAASTSIISGSFVPYILPR